jgi:glutaredoxin-like YruB-family protein
VTSGTPNHAPRITVYTTPACHWCVTAKRYLADRGLEYSEIDVTHDRRGLKQMVLMTGQRGVPVIQVGSHAMIGWDKHEFERLLSGRFKRR